MKDRAAETPVGAPYINGGIVKKIMTISKLRAQNTLSSNGFLISVFPKDPKQITLCGNYMDPIIR